MTEFDSEVTLSRPAGGPPVPVVGGRYALGDTIGRGAFGVVYSAQDLVTGSSVALKAMEATPQRMNRIQREVAALRMLRIPGVVDLLDDFCADGQYYVVMELLVGQPFPGRPTPVTWADLRGPTLRLLQTLARVHDVGVVHRDLKPANILTDANGQPTVLDFGLATGEPMQSTFTQTGAVLGTPAYLAPEQCEGRKVDSRADLFAVGAILYQALTGEIPHAASSSEAIMRARVTRAATPVEQRVDVPAAVAEAIGRLLRRRPADRPRSATEVSRLLSQGETALELPNRRWLGPNDHLDTLAQLVLSGHSVDVAGYSGSGRTRALQELGHRLRAEGFGTVWLPPSDRPFGSLAPLGIDPNSLGNVPLQEAIETLADTCRDRLRDNTAALIDDCSAVDRWSLQVLNRLGTNVRIAGVDVPLAAHRVDIPPLSPNDLQPLFHGPERILRLRSDAAGLLHERTRGLPARIWDELRSWEHSGTAVWDRGALRIERTVLDELLTGVRLSRTGLANPVETRAQTRSRSKSGIRTTILEIRSELVDLLAWIGLFWPVAPLSALADARAEPAWKIAAAVQELLEAELVAEVGESAITLTSLGAEHATMSRARMREARRAIGLTLPSGHPSRLSHLVAAEAWASVVHESRVRAELLLSRGNLRAAIAAALAGIRASRWAGSADAVDELARLVALCALSSRQPSLIDTALYEVRRIDFQSKNLVCRQLEACSLLSTAPEHDALPTLLQSPAADSELEQQRWSYALRLASGCAPEQVSSILDRACAWATQQGSPKALAASVGWRAGVLYRTGEYEKAVATVREADLTALPTTDQALMYNVSAAAALELFEPETAYELAKHGLELAQTSQNHVLEADAEWLLRTAQYRSGLNLSVDSEFLAAVDHLEAPQVAAVAYLTEAAIAWRSGAPVRARKFSLRASERFRAVGRHEESLLSDALALRLRPGAEPISRSFVDRALGCTIDGIGIQALALVADGVPANWLAEIRDWSQWPATQRRDILSYEECLRLLNQTRPTDAAYLPESD